MDCGKHILKGDNLDFTSRVICACFNQIMNFESWKWPPVATFKSWTNKSALSFFDFALFHGQKQVLSQIVTVVVETSQKSDTSIFSSFYDRTWNLAKIRHFNFKKVRENWSVWFLWSFMYPGSWNLEKIEMTDFR